MPEYLTPGVYIEEIEIGAKPIEGVSTSTAGFLGQTERGPLEPRLITSFEQFKKLYGGYRADSYLAYEVEGFFRNGGRRCYVARIVGGSSNAAENTARMEFSNSGNVMRVEAAAPGENGNNIYIKIEDVTDETPDPLAFVLTVKFSDSDRPSYNLSADPYTTSTKFPYYAKQGAAGDRIVLRAINTGKPRILSETNLTGGSDTKVASRDIGADSRVIRIEANARGEDGNKISIKIEDATDGTPDPLAFMLTVSRPKSSSVIYRLSADPDTKSVNFPYYAKQGVAGPDISLKFINKGKPGVLSETKLTGGSDTKVASQDITKSAGPENNMKLKISALGPGVSGNNIQISIENAGLSSYNPQLFKLRVIYEDVEEIYDNISIRSSSSDCYINRVNGISNLIVTGSDGPLLYRPDNVNKVSLNDGKSNPATKEDYEGSVVYEDIEKRTGWMALNRINDISIYCEPVDDASIQDSLTDSVITHCENMKDRFAILQTPGKTTTDIANLWPTKDSKYAALYHPWIEILDPLTNLPKFIPPAGHIAGIYARTDGLRGVHKAPANETVSGIIGLKFDIQRGEQDILNPRGVNCIRAFPGQGIKVWGARTISRDPLWKYVNVRRLFIYLEKSIERGTQWVVFEPNDEKLWARVRQTINQFLTTVWRSGALMGTTQDEAFFVKCDRTTMTQDDIDNGRLIIMVGIAPVKPAEFVIFRIAQVAKGSEISE